MSSYALLKNGKLVRMSTSSIDATSALLTPEIDSVHKVESLADLEKVLKGESASQPAPSAEPDILADLENLFKLGTDELLVSLKERGNTAFEQASSLIQQAKVEGSKTLNLIRQKIHEATKPRE